MEEIILQTLKKMRTDYGNNEMIIFAQDSDLQVVADEIKTAINFTYCCTELKTEKKLSYKDWKKENGYSQASHGYYKKEDSIIKSLDVIRMYKDYESSF